MQLIKKRKGCVHTTNRIKQHLCVPNNSNGKKEEE